MLKLYLVFLLDCRLYCKNMQIIQSHPTQSQSTPHENKILTATVFLVGIVIISNLIGAIVDIYTCRRWPALRMPSHVQQLHARQLPSCNSDQEQLRKASPLILSRFVTLKTQVYLLEFRHFRAYPLQNASHDNFRYDGRHINFRHRSLLVHLRLLICRSCLQKTPTNPGSVFFAAVSVYTKCCDRYAILKAIAYCLPYAYYRFQIK
jgi:hypothetical protein